MAVQDKIFLADALAPNGQKASSASTESRQSGAFWRQAGVQLRKWAPELPLEPILHSSVRRVRCIGLIIIFGQLIFGWLLAAWRPQPWESDWLRVAMVLLALPLVLWREKSRFSRSDEWAILFDLWLQFPAFVIWMFLCNGGSGIWLSGIVAMLLIYYQLTDWRLATIGIAAAVVLVSALFLVAGPDVGLWANQHLLAGGTAFAFVWALAASLARSSTNLRRGRMEQVLTTLGIMAHELRTPLATVSLVGDALSAEVEQLEGERAGRIPGLVRRLYALSREMNHEIDVQIANAGLLRVQPGQEEICASELIRRAVHEYPFKDSRQRQCFTTEIRQDFVFRGNFGQFHQVVSNLLTNAFLAIAETEQLPTRGDVNIVVDVHEGRGLIRVRDRGIGIEPSLQGQIFDPFFTTSERTRIGLGLAYCRRVVEAVDGEIDVTSFPGQGASFCIRLQPEQLVRNT